ncbi:MAG: 50S ribosomal protein L3 [Candidatus Edwardsbacteria bacterium]|jgi:large subunit ribosomal protein L3|nr:50S ribosomal protein L3 [Candidatus Edwardsbacteria bacterium]
MNGLIAKKIGMTTYFAEGNKAYPVTVLEAGPCVVTQVKSAAGDGYAAVQLGFGAKKEKSCTKAIKGHCAKAKASPQAVLREFKVADPAAFQPGQVIKSDIFAAGDMVKVTGSMKGRGNAGVVKRHGFHGGPGSHGQTDRLRHPGTNGAGSTPGRVYKGRRMAGHMGASTVTTRNLKVVLVDADKNLLLVRGAVPGAADGIVIIQKV